MGHHGESAIKIVKLIITHKVNCVIYIYHKIVDCDVSYYLESVFSRTVNNRAENLGNHFAQLTLLTG